MKPITMLSKSHHSVPKMPNAKNGPITFVRGSRARENGKAARNGRNHPQLPSDGTILKPTATHNAK
jgi:hypothetical protein